MKRPVKYTDWLFGPTYAQLLYKYYPQGDEFRWFYAYKQPLNWATVNGLITMHQNVRFKNFNECEHLVIFNNVLF